ncbi:YbhB/YbcL family Raf kinase inhibitor-like protein [Bordetella avium]|uniref:Phospholipid-binding protein n=1 Tax=Bordetella avium (strain 197N) TaxID=360910 RepID=Q2KV14_BORA1|nr:YbhB/YbcL family Raf kinase inhibitor-like protein [Bordetella avium]AZY50311.1 YbhB/YbcL family Raf kinase inhibitor-like protein [Bordetella avium]AZY53705.1 YbhB/YbcL family Raf kinase inhibitor-like protein [Bordetella avium]RIQ15521.1 YbhB/YbcL family Raf kinase inhibitor-like protein [Bordetella avium]RIQ38368.1 YbhB/YbcL family Raf kinase inhibitor-like protein [Bordetella avium]RIQ42908.1 YbhB/YbcL family Raf kinase inhibitor-like protein [Bordetella avium]
MKLASLSFVNGESIPERYAFGRIDPQSHVALADNFNPQFSWDDVPAGTQSFALLCVDPHVPSQPDDVNQEGREVPASLPRLDFYHWVLIDLPAHLREIEEGAYSHDVTPRGKGGPLAPDDVRQGLNDYTGWFASDRDMSGDYFGYDGPCPPWNDAIVHDYVFTLYALDVPRLAVEGKFTGPEVLKAMEGHILAQASVTGTYTLNPALAPCQIGATSAS